MASTSKVLSLGLFLGLLTLSFASLTAFDRSAYIILKKHARIEKIFRDCETVGKTETVLATIYKPAKSRVLGYRCDVTYTRVLIDTCNGTESVVSSGPETIGRDACLEAHKVHFSGMQPADLGSNYVHTDQRTVNEGNHFIDGHNIEVRYNITLSEMTGFIDFENGLVNFGGPDVCDLAYHSCGGYYWQVPRPRTDDVIYQGTADVVGYFYHFLASARVYFLVTRDQDNAYVEEVSSVRVNLEDASTLFRSTHHPDVFIQISGRDDNSRGGWRIRPDLNLSHVYVETHHGQEVRSADVAGRFCRTEQKELSRMLRSRLESVALFSPVYLKDGIVITKLNHSVAVGQCAQVKATSRLTDECFEEIPVYDSQGREAFLHPVNRYFHNCSRLTECGTVPVEDEGAITKPLSTTTTNQDNLTTEAPQKSDDNSGALFLFGLLGLLAAGAG